MKKDLPAAVASIAKFIDWDMDISPAILDQVVKRTTFDVMKSDPKANHSWNAHHRDPNEAPFMRKGVVGDWKHLLTAEQSKRMDILYQKLEAAGLEFDFCETA
jgi:amine sulfotransferase